jgi:hypothetical protein
MSKKNRKFPQIRVTEEAREYLKQAVDAFNATGLSTSMSSLASEQIFQIKLPEKPQEK